MYRLSTIINYAPYTELNRIVRGSARFPPRVQGLGCAEERVAKTQIGRCNETVERTDVCTETKDRGREERGWKEAKEKMGWEIGPVDSQL